MPPTSIRVLAECPNTGLLLTINQFFMTTLFALPSQFTRAVSSNFRASWHFRRPEIPLERLAFMALMFFVVNMLNNWAFAFSISVPLHIILRSFGSVQTMVVGWFCGKKYSKTQIGSVVALTVGVIVSAWADAMTKGKKMSLTPTSASENATYANGLLILFTAQLISAFMGVYTETTYATYGRHWRDVLFYSHFFGLLFSLAFLPTLSAQLVRLLAGPPASLPSGVFSVAATVVPTGWLQRYDIAGAGGSVSKSAVLLLLNGMTQVACISGVNLLGARTSAVMVTVVLNVRKLVSFLLSCIIFGNPIGGVSAVGATVVFVSGAVYGWDESTRKSRKAIEKDGTSNAAVTEGAVDSDVGKKTTKEVRRS